MVCVRGGCGVCERGMWCVWGGWGGISKYMRVRGACSSHIVLVLQREGDVCVCGGGGGGGYPNT